MSGIIKTEKRVFKFGFNDTVSYAGGLQEEINILEGTIKEREGSLSSSGLVYKEEMLLMWPEERERLKNLKRSLAEVGNSLHRRMTGT